MIIANIHLGMPVIVPPDYPEDNDTNAVAFSIVKPSESRITELINEIAACTNADGIIQVRSDGAPLLCIR